MKKINIEKMISYLIANKRQALVNALVLSDINIGKESTDKQLLATTMDELNNGNEKLMINLGKVFDDNFNLEPLFNKEEQYSNTFGDFFKANSGAILSGGLGLLKGLFGGKGKGTPTSSTPTVGGNSDLSTIMLMQQQQAAAAQAQRDADAKAAASKRANTTIILSVVGGLVVIGGITAIVLTRNKEK